MALTYAKAERTLQRARNKVIGTPIKNKTRLCQRSDHIAVKHYATDILRLYPDGSMQICTDYTSTTTLDRLGRYTDFWIGSERLPSFNGRRPDRERAYFISGKNQRCVFNGVGGYLSVDAAGVIDIASVKPITLRTIGEPATINQIVRKGREICKQLLIRMKLKGIDFHKYCVDRYFSSRLLDSVNTPLEHVNFDYLLGEGISEEQYETGLAGQQKNIAARFGLLTEVKFSGLI